MARRAFSGELPVETGLREALSLVAFIVLPIGVAALACAAAAGAAQTRGLVDAGRFFAPAHGDDEAALPLVGWGLAAALVLFAVSSGRQALAGMTALPSLWLRALLLCGAAGAADYLLRRARVERSLRMTRAERRAEERQEEGDRSCAPSGGGGIGRWPAAPSSTIWRARR